jgi:hypothetical protein
VKLGTAGPKNLRANFDARKSAADAFALRLSGLVKGFEARALTQRAMWLS